MVRPLFGATMALLLVLGAASVSADEGLAALVAKLRSADPRAPYEAYAALNRRNDPAAVPLLVKALPGAGDMGQYYGVLLLQRVPAKAGSQALRALLGARSRYLRLLAAVALQRRGVRRASDVIVKALEAKDVPAVRRALFLTRIYSVRDPAVQRAVRSFLRADAAPAVLAAAVYDVYLVRDKDAVPPLRTLLTSDDLGVRALVAACLMVLGDGGHADALAKAVSQGAITTGQLSRIKMMLAQARPVPVSVLAAVTAHLAAETNPTALRMYVQLLGEHGYVKGTAEVRKLLDDDNDLVAKAAFEALSRFPGGVTPKALHKLLVSGDATRKIAAADALRRADDPSGLPVVLSILASGKGADDRGEAARVLGSFRQAAVVEPLLAALDDDDLSVRSNAYNSLGTVLRTLFPYRRLDLGRTGYATNATPAMRKTGVARLRAWWAKNKRADW